MYESKSFTVYHVLHDIKFSIVCPIIAAIMSVSLDEGVDKSNDVTGKGVATSAFGKKRVGMFSGPDHVRFIFRRKSRDMSHMRSSVQVGEGEDILVALSLSYFKYMIEHGNGLDESERKQTYLKCVQGSIHCLKSVQKIDSSFTTGTTSH